VNLSSIIGWIVFIVIVVWAFKHPETVAGWFNTVGHALSTWTNS
jgi:hypothetical protein